MTQEVVFEMNANDANTVRAWMNAKNSVAAYEAQLNKLDGAQSKNAKSAQQFDRAAQAIFANTRTPMEKYEASLADLNELYVSNKVNSETYNRAVAKLKDTLAQDDGSAARKAAATKSADEAMKAQDKLEQQAAARSLARQKAKALEQEKLEQQQAARSLARQKATAERVEKAEQQAAVRSLARQKAAALEGQRLSESVATAQEQHNSRIARYRELLKSGSIDQQTFNRSVRASKTELDNAGSSVGNMANRIVGLAAGYVSLTAGISAYRQAAQAAMDDAEKAADKQDEIARRFRVQAGLDALQGEKARESINNVAQSTGSTSESAFGAATALTSTGFDAKEAQGPALEATLKLIQAQQLKGKSVNADELAEAASKYLASQGKAKTGANLQELAVAIQGLKETPLKITDLEQLAKQGATLKGKIGYKEQIANFAMLLESMDAEKSGTSLREIALHMSTAGGAKDKTKALKSIGLKPEDVDLVGESFEDALAKIEGGLQKIPESKRAATLKTLFEGANIAAYELLAKNQDKVKRYVGQEGDVAGFEADYNVGSTGRNAAKRRLTVEKETLDTRAGEDQQYENTRLAYQNVLQEKGVGFFSRSLKGMEYRFLTSFGVSPESAVRYTAPTKDDFGTNEDYTKAVKDKVAEANDPQGFLKQQLEEMRKQTAIMQQQAAGGKPGAGPNVVVTMPGNAAPAKPVAAAGIGGNRP